MGRAGCRRARLHLTHDQDATAPSRKSHLHASPISRSRRPALRSLTLPHRRSPLPEEPSTLDALPRAHCHLRTNCLFTSRARWFATLARHPQPHATQKWATPTETIGQTWKCPLQQNPFAAPPLGAHAPRHVRHVQLATVSCTCCSKADPRASCGRSRSALKRTSCCGASWSSWSPCPRSSPTAS